MNSFDQAHCQCSSIQTEAAGLIGLADRRVKNGFSTEVLTAEQAWELEPALSRDIVGAVLFPEDAQVRNPKMVTALAKGAAKLGAKFQLGNPAHQFRPGGWARCWGRCERRSLIC